MTTTRHLISKYVCLIVVLTWLLPVCLQAQQPYQQLELDHCILKYRLWTTDDGLHHWRINDLFVDSQGYLWVCHSQYKSLSRFDGSSFELMDTIKNRVSGHGEDLNGNIWYLTSNNIRILDPDTRVSYSFKEYVGVDWRKDYSSYARPKLYSIDQVIYLFLPEQSELWRYNGQWEQALSGLPAYLDTEPQKTICFPGPEQTWWLTDGTQVELLDRQGKRLSRQDALIPEKDLLVYVADQLYTYHPAPSVGESPDIRSVSSGLQTFPEGADIPVRWPDSKMFNGSMYLLPEFQMSLFTNQKGAPVLFDYQRNALLDLSHELALDLEQSPYFKGDIIPPIALGDGMFMLYVPSQRALLQIEILSKYFTPLVVEASYSSLAFTGGERLLAIKEDVGVQAVELSTRAVSDIDLGGIAPPGSPFWGIVPDYVYGIQGQAWLGYRRGGGMLRLEAQGRVTTELLLPAMAGKLLDILPLTDSLWLYTSGREMGTVNVYTRKNKPLKKFVGVHPTSNSLFLDQRGHKWTGTSNGIYYLDEDRIYLDSLRGNRLYVFHIHESAEGTFWLSTNQGLVMWQPGMDEYEIYDQSDGFISKFIYTAYPDTLGRLWLSSDKGITSWNMATKQVVNYLRTDGLASNEQLVNAHVRGPDGRLYFGSTDGITVFDPNAIPQEVALRLPALTIDRVDQLNYAGAKLPPVYPGGDRSGRIRIDRSCIQTVVQFSHPYFREKALSYAWRIAGLSTQWTTFDSNQELTISGMPRGNYELEVRVSEAANPHFNHTYRFVFYKGYYLYQRGWFQMLTVLLVLGLLGIGVHWRLRVLSVRDEWLEEKVLARTQELQKQNEKLEQLDAAKTQLFNNISHEFRTPLSIIRVQSDRIKRKYEIKHEGKADFQQIESQINHLSLMLDDVMDLSKLQMEMLQLRSELVNWPAFVRRVFAMFDGLACQKQLDYRLEMEQGEDTFLWMDMAKAERILTNLIGNALKFTPEVGRILVRSTYRDGQVEVVVSDTGPGVPIEEQETIFDRYQQGSAALGIAQSGYGIGLALCREYTKLMKGRLWVESAVGQGSSFFLQLPVIEASPDDLPSLRKEKEAVVSPRTFARVAEKGKHGHILIAEDHPDLLHFLELELSPEYDISIATNGNQAWEILEGDRSIDLVISDVMMPLMDGFTLLQQTRSHPQLGFTPFLFLTALVSDADRLKALRLGVDSYLIKPFSLEELRVRLGNLMGQQRERKDFVKAGGVEQKSESPTIPHPQNTEDDAPESYEDEWLCKLESVVWENLHHTYFKVPLLAEKMYVSERTLYTRVKGYTGLSTAVYLRKARLELARQYFEAHKYKTVKEVAYAVGMKDARNFSKLYKKEFGRWPGSYFMK